jgi:hypothetical protein
MKLDTHVHTLYFALEVQFNRQLLFDITQRPELRIPELA